MNAALGTKFINYRWNITAIVNLNLYGKQLAGATLTFTKPVRFQRYIISKNQFINFTPKVSLIAGKVVTSSTWNGAITLSGAITEIDVGATGQTTVTLAGANITVRRCYFEQLLIFSFSLSQCK